jgi:hypothetical protein
LHLKGERQNDLANDALTRFGLKGETEMAMKTNNLMGSARVACTVIGVAASIALSAGPAMAQVADATPVTDPSALKAMGFSPSARNVYVSNALVKAQQAQQAQDGRTDEFATVPQLTPTTGTDYSAISAKEFFGRIDTTGTQWAYNGGPNCCVDLSRAGSEMFADAQFQVPTGATLDFFRFWAFDSNAGSDLAFFVFRVCQPAFAGGAPTITTIVSTSTSGAPGNTTGLASLNELVDNQACVYQARVRFDAAGSTLALQKVRLQFTR